MYCKKCGSDKHWDSDCVLLDADTKKALMDAVLNVPAERSVGSESRSQPEAVPSTCPECGSTPEIFSDAKKWATVRDKQRRRMREYRRK